MRGRRTVRVGMGLPAIAIAIGLVSAGCFAPGPAAPAAPANLTVSPSQWTINAPPAGTMPTLMVTVTNTGGHSAQVLPINGVGVYSIPSNSCTTLAAGQSCQVGIQFCPGAAGGTFQNTLMINGHDATTGSLLHATVLLDGNSP